MLNFISENNMLINALLTFATVVTSCITIISTNRNAKKQRQDSEAARRQQQEQFDRSLKEQRIQYAEECKRFEEVERLHQQPYLVFKRAEDFQRISETEYEMKLFFINKGRGAAYEIEPDVSCEKRTYDGRVSLSRCEPILDPIALVNEELITHWRIQSESGKLDVQMFVKICYNDASGRKYVQRFRMTIRKAGTVMVTNYATPELEEND